VIKRLNVLSFQQVFQCSLICGRPKTNISYIKSSYRVPAKPLTGDHNIILKMSMYRIIDSKIC